MNVSKVNESMNFKGISVPKNMPKEIITAIKNNPVIKKAEKNYSLHFLYSKEPTNNVHVTKLIVSSPNMDSLFNLFVTPPHAVKYQAYYLGRRPNGTLRKLEEIKNTPDFFEKDLGKPRTLKQKLTALKEAFEIAFMPNENKRTVNQEIRIGKILEKYK